MPRTRPTAVLICLMLACCPAPARGKVYLPPSALSVEYVVARSAVVVRGTVAKPSKAAQDAGPTEIAVWVDEWVKGAPAGGASATRPPGIIRVASPAYLAAFPRPEEVSPGAEVLACLSPAGPARTARNRLSIDPAPSALTVQELFPTQPYDPGAKYDAAAVWARGQDGLAESPGTPAASRRASYSAPLITLDLKTVRDFDALLAAVRRAARDEAAAGPPDAERGLMVPLDPAERSPATALGEMAAQRRVVPFGRNPEEWRWVTVPGDGRLQAAGRRWAASPNASVSYASLQILRLYRSDQNAELLRGFLTGAGRACPSNNMGPPTAAARAGPGAGGQWKWAQWVSLNATEAGGLLREWGYDVPPAPTRPLLEHAPLSGKALTATATAPATFVLAVAGLAFIVGRRKGRRVSRRQGLKLGFTALLLMLLAVEGGMYARSYWRADEAVASRGSVLHELSSDRGAVKYWFVEDWGEPTPLSLGSFAQEEVEPFGFFDVTTLSPPTQHGRWGFRYAADDGAVLTYRRFEVPYWALMGLTALPLLAKLRTAARSWRRARAGCCPRCGYDLRASAGRCPECGTDVEPRAEVSRPKS